jgi:hypothetical protein
VTNNTQFPREFNRHLFDQLDGRFLMLLLLSLLVNVAFIYYMNQIWEMPKFLDWTSEHIIEEIQGVELKVDNDLQRPLGLTSGDVGTTTPEIETTEDAGPSGPKRVNRSSIGGGRRYAGHDVAFMAPSGGTASTDRARKEFAPLIGDSKGYDFRPGQLGVHTEAGALPALASVRKGPAEINQAGGMTTVSGVYAFSDQEGALGMSGTVEIGVTTRDEDEDVGTGGTRQYRSIYDVVSSNRGEVFYCLHSERKRDVNLKGNIDMEVTINKAGAVTKVVFTESTWWSNPTSGKRVEQCIRNIISSWDFGMGSGDPKGLTTFNLSFLWS